MFDFTTVKEVSLSKGSHNSPEQGMCFMEMAAWFAGEEHSDKPACVSPALGALGIALNDSMGNERDQLLKPLIPQVVGTFDEKAEQGRIEYMCVRAFNYGAGILMPEFGRRYRGGLRTFSDVRHAARWLCYDNYGGPYAVGQMTPTFIHSSAQHEQLFRTLVAVTEMRLPYFSYSIEALDEQPVVEKTFHKLPNIENARAAAGVFSIVGDIIPDWSAGIDTLREAIKLGRHDGFDAVANLAARHEALRELVDA